MSLRRLQSPCFLRRDTCVLLLYVANLRMRQKSVTFSAAAVRHPVINDHQLNRLVCLGERRFDAATNRSPLHTGMIIVTKPAERIGVTISAIRLNISLFKIVACIRRCVRTQGREQVPLDPPCQMTKPPTRYSRIKVRDVPPFGDQ